MLPELGLELALPVLILFDPLILSEDRRVK